MKPSWAFGLFGVQILAFCIPHDAQNISQAQVKNWRDLPDAPLSLEVGLGAAELVTPQSQLHRTTMDPNTRG